MCAGSQGEPRGLEGLEAPPAAAPAGSVVVYLSRTSRRPRHHELATYAAVARTLAALKGYAFAGDFDPARRYPGALYLLPADTLESFEAAQALGIHGGQDLFGGVVPFPFVATKAITHALVGDGSAAPQGWSSCFGDRVRDVVLPGFSAFAASDALAAGKRLLGQGQVRLKRAGGIGGSGQSVVHSLGQLEEAVAALGAEDWREGLVLEANLNDVETRSVGQVRVGDLLATYAGTQKTTRNNRGEEAYGGSTLTVVRGDYDRLLALPLPARVRTAISQAQTYHEAALDCFPGMFASRANYDVAQGVDDAGQWRSGVLEQSWRVGGASGAEMQALQAFSADPELRVVRASTTELYGADVCVPCGASVYFAGEDEHTGAITKYSELEVHAHA